MARKHKKRRTHVEEDTQVKRRRGGEEGRRGGGEDIDVDNEEREDWEEEEEKKHYCDDREAVVDLVPFPNFPPLGSFFLFFCICIFTPVTPFSTLCRHHIYLVCSFPCSLISG